MSHTYQTPVLRYTRGIYEVTLFASAKTVTAQIVCTTNNRTETKSFRSKYGSNRQAAENWAETQVDNFLESQKLYGGG